VLGGGLLALAELLCELLGRERDEPDVGLELGQLDERRDEDRLDLLQFPRTSGRIPAARI